MRPAVDLPKVVEGRAAAVSEGKSRGIDWDRLLDPATGSPVGKARKPVGTTTCGIFINIPDPPPPAEKQQEPPVSPPAVRHRTRRYPPEPDLGFDLQLHIALPLFVPPPLPRLRGQPNEDYPPPLSPPPTHPAGFLSILIPPTRNIHALWAQLREVLDKNHVHPPLFSVVLSIRCPHAPPGDGGGMGATYLKTGYQWQAYVEALSGSAGGGVCACGCGGGAEWLRGRVVVQVVVRSWVFAFR